MRRTMIWIAAGALAFAGSTATAGDRQDQLERLQQMQQELEQLENRADAADDELAAVNGRAEQQQELIQSSGLAEARGASSGLASFLESLEVGGWVAASYNYNFNDIDGGSLGGANTGGGGYPFHPDSNTFSLDQVWFELEKPVSEDSRGGFRADIQYGNIAEILGNGGAVGDGLSGGERDLELYQGYVQYLAPIGNGVTFKAGKFATPIGAEVAQQPYNFNITRGQVYNLLQPITHTGVIASMENDGASMAIGATNSTIANLDIDNNNNKSAIWHMGYAQDTMGFSFNGLWGSPGGSDESSKEAILDLILSFDPSEQFSGYVNATYRELENAFAGGTQDASAWGAAAAGRFALSDRTGLAIRGEYVDDKDSFFSALGSGASAALLGRDTELISVTGTLDHLLTEKLMLRVEARWDEVDVDSPTVALTPGEDDVFASDGSPEDDQIVGAVELIYSF